MSVLLDTHVAIWSVSGLSRLPAGLVSVLRANAGATFVSPVTLWEIAMKFGLPRRDQMPFDAEVAHGLFAEAGHQVLDIRPKHAIAMGKLAKLHGDPFDRLLVAQATSEGMTFLTLDRLLADYHPSVLAF